MADGKVIMVQESGYHDGAWLFTNKNDAESYESRYGNTEVELNQEHIDMLLAGCVLLVEVEEFTVTVKVKRREVK